MFSQWYESYGKRLFDLSVSLLLIVLALPLLGVLVILTRWQMGSPVIFRQPRAGKGGKPFVLYKLRTMTDERDGHGNLLSDAERITSVGRFLRSSSLDELPTLFNVLRGDVSLVGPRPLLIRYLERYTPEQMRRHAVKPGITGWAQINGRNAISWEEKFRHDVWYVKHLSFWLDLKILFLTITKVLRREGVSPADQVTMEEFFGTQRGIGT